tara:strand:- start:332 stop:3379 length:3048 start_codon:yes stop_codon:yes gene_type:complete
MVQINAYEQGSTTQYELDVPETPIELNYQFIDLNDPLSRRSPYSFRFTLPLSSENNKFFSFYYDANVAEGTFDAMLKTECNLLNDGVLLMQGSLQMYSVTEKGFEVSILEQVSQVFDSVKGVTWQQLFTTAHGTLDTDLDHALNWNNVKDSWVTTNDITTGGVGAGTIVYPLADSAQGLGINSQEAGTGLGFYYNQGFGMQDANLSVLNLKPSIRVAYLIEYIFNKAGFTLDSTFLNTADFQKVYMFLALETVRTQGRPSYGFQVGLTNDILLQTSNASMWFPLNFYEESVPPFYDPDALTSGGVFSVPYDGVFTLKTNIVVTSGGSSGGFIFQIRLLVNGQSSEQDTAQSVGYGTTTIVSDLRTLQLSAGDSVSVAVSSTNVSYDVTMLQTGASTATYFELISYSTASQFVDVSQNFPDVSVDEWLKAIVQRFNLVIVSSPSKPTVLEIEPWSEWWTAGTNNKDWTEIVDQDSIKIESTLEFQKKTYEFTDAEGDNFTNKWWQHHFGWIKGKYSFLNENDFVSEQAKTEEIFQPYRNRAIFANVLNDVGTNVPNVLVPQFWEWATGSSALSEKNWVACKPVLAYYNGLQDIGNGVTFQFGGANYTTYPYFAEFNTVGVDLTTKSLAWGYDYPDNFEAPFISGGTSGGTTLRYAFYEYWSQLFSEIYSADARVMTCKVNLSYADIYNLKFNDNLYLDGCFWKVLSIDNFSVGGDGLANAKLIKVINKPIGRSSTSCNARPCGFNSDGTVDFCDSVTGAPVSPTETCCRLAGYVWNEVGGRCFSRNGGDGGGGGGGGGNGGGGIGDGKPVDSFVHSPNSYGNFPRSDVKSFQQKGVVGTNINTNLILSTSGATPAQAQTDSGTRRWLIPQDTVMYVRVQAVAVESSGSAATIGNAVTQNTQATIANTRTAIASKAVARDVGVTTVVAENKDVGASATIDITSAQATDGAEATFSVTCTGASNIDFVWFIDMQVTAVQIRGTSETIGRPIIYNLDPNEVEFGNLTPDTPMYYNLPLL